MTTTIKVSDELRDRLKEQAARSGLTLGAHLANLAASEDRRLRLEQLKHAVATTDLPDGAREEDEQWERTELTDPR